MTSFTGLLSTMRRVFQDNDILYALAASVACHESGILRPQGASQLALKYHNWYGIKGVGTRGSINLQTWEYAPENVIADGFAVYASVADSVRHFQRLLTYQRYKAVRQAKTVKNAIMALHKGGYATDPNYSSKVYNTYLKLIPWLGI